jgi:hypothetical protein
MWLIDWKRLVVDALERSMVAVKEERAGGGKEASYARRLWRRGGTGQGDVSEKGTGTKC